jgi:hypothetical protein
VRVPVPSGAPPGWARMALDQVAMTEARVVGSWMRAERRWFGRICGRDGIAAKFATEEVGDEGGGGDTSERAVIGAVVLGEG